MLAVRLQRRDEEDPYVMSTEAAYLREKDLAFELLEEMYEKRNANLV